MRLNDRLKTLLSIAVAAVAVAGLTMLTLVVPQSLKAPPETVSVRRVDIQIPPPPEPPPPIEPEPTSQSTPTPSVNVAGFQSAVALDYHKKPDIQAMNVKRVQKPTFDVDSINMHETLSVNFPIVGVQNLDAMPRTVNSRPVPIPRSLRKRGIERVETQVQIIITETGRAYIKRIVDPVYPEMVAPIRKFIKNLRFTPPTKNGMPVQAQYDYSLNFNYQIY